MFIYCFYSSLDASWAGNMAHTHDNHEFYFCLDGNCWQRAGGQVFPMAAGEFCLLPRRMPHKAWRQDRAKVSHNIVVNVADEYLSPTRSGDKDAKAVLDLLCRRAAAGKSLIPLSARSRTQVESLMRLMADETQARGAGWQALVKAAFINLLCAVYRYWPENGDALALLPDAGREGRMQAVLAYIDNNYMKPLMVEDLLPLAHLSRSRFHAVFNAEAGCPFKTYLNRLRVAEAKKSLAASDISVAEIALGCGFNSLSQFYNAFKEVCGETPNHWRRHKGI